MMAACIERCEITGPNDGWLSLYATVMGDTSVECRELAERIKGTVAQGKRRLFRADVWAEEQMVFSTGKVMARGGVRFAFRDEAGADEAVAAGSSSEIRFMPLPKLETA